MKTVTVDAADLATEIKWMTKLGSSTPPAGVVQVRILLGALQLRRTDLEQYRESLIPGQGADQSCIEVDTVRFSDLMKGERGPATVGIDGDHLSIQLPNRILRINSVEADFPEWPVFERGKERAAVLGAKQLSRALTSVTTDDTLPALTNAYFEKGVIYTTDRYRMTRVIYDTDGLTALVPAQALRSFTSGNRVVTVKTGLGSQFGTTDIPMVQMSSGGRTVTVRIPDHSFPQVEHLIPVSPDIKVMFRRSQLIAAASGEYVTLIVDGNSMRVVSSSSDKVVEIEEKIEVTPLVESADPFTITLRTKYLHDCLRTMASGLALLEATGPLKPLMFSDISGTTNHLIMPYRNG